MQRGDSVIEISTGKEYIVFDESDTDICIIEWFDFEPYPYQRQLKIWQSKERFEDKEK